jgi:hypothetical protein
MFERIAKLFGASPSPVVDALVRKVAELSVESVAARVAVQVEAMSLPEARGYIRARATQVVRRQTRLAIAKHPGASLAWTRSIVRASTERLLPLVLRKTGVGLPRQYAEVRAAA